MNRCVMSGNKPKEKNKTQEDERQNVKGEIGKIKNLSDEELIKTFLSYMFSGEKYENALLMLEDICADELMNPDALLVAFGGITSKADTLIRVLKALKSATKKEKTVTVSSKENLEQVLVEKIGNSVDEKIYVGFLNNKGVVEHTCSFSLNEKSSVGFEINKIASEYRRLSAKSIIIEHNHPSGSLALSQRDYLTMCELETKMELLNISLSAQYIVSATGCRRINVKDEDCYGI